jgi:hypothetical protein
MPLFDHFSPPLKSKRFWQSFHSVWANAIASSLNKQLSPRYLASPTVHFGIEIDVAALDQNPGTAQTESAAPTWPVPAPTLTLPLTLVTDIVQIDIRDTREGPEVVGAIELVSPANKDRPASRGAFVSKCQALLQQGVGLMVVDIVTERRANLHEELLVHLGHLDVPTWDAQLYASAYRPVVRASESQFDIWKEQLDVGKPLPIMPLWLREAICLRVDLDDTYRYACREQRIDDSTLA